MILVLTMILVLSVGVLSFMFLVVVSFMLHSGMIAVLRRSVAAMVAFFRGCSLLAI
jgi:hypothetical protein